MGRACGTYGGLEGKRALGRQMVEYKMYLEEGGCRSMDWIELAQERDRWQALVGNEPWGSIKCRESLD